LSLSKDYSSLIRENGIVGEVLIEMSEDDFKAIGITAFGDLRRLPKKVAELQKK